MSQHISADYGAKFFSDVIAVADQRIDMPQSPVLIALMGLAEDPQSLVNLAADALRLHHSIMTSDGAVRQALGKLPTPCPLVGLKTVDMEVRFNK